MLEVFDKIKEIWKTITSINKRLEALEKNPYQRSPSGIHLS